MPAAAAAPAVAEEADSEPELVCICHPVATPVLQLALATSVPVSHGVQNLAVAAAVASVPLPAAQNSRAAEHAEPAVHGLAVHAEPAAHALLLNAEHCHAAVTECPQQHSQVPQ